MAHWSKPYYGVSHAEVNRRQCTVMDYGSFVRALVFPITGTPRFFSSAIERDFPRDDRPTTFPWATARSPYADDAVVGAARVWAEQAAGGVMQEAR